MKTSQPVVPAVISSSDVCSDLQAGKIDDRAAPHDTIPIMPPYVGRLRAQHYKSVRDIFCDAFHTEGLKTSDLGISWRNKAYALGVFSWNGDLLGFVITSFHKRSGGSRYIDYLAIHSAYRGQNLGNKLLKFVRRISYIEKKSLHLWPLNNKKLIDWYKSHGFYHSNGTYYTSHTYETRSQAPFQSSLTSSKYTSD